jgi:hypothetical protein
VFGTKREAESAVNEAVLNAERGIDLAPSRVTVKELLDRYLADRESLGRGAKTMDEYRRFNVLYIEPRLGSFAVAKLRPGHVSEWIATLLKEGGLVLKDAATKLQLRADWQRRKPAVAGFQWLRGQDLNL